jgi:hypothetical protein
LHTFLHTQFFLVCRNIKSVQITNSDKKATNRFRTEVAHNKVCNCTLFLRWCAAANPRHAWLRGKVAHLHTFSGGIYEKCFYLDKKMQTKNHDTQALSAAQVRRKHKANEIRRRIRQEWQETERDHMQNKVKAPANFPTLQQIAAAAGEDFRKHGHTYGTRKKIFRFYWKPANCERIKVAYYLTRFSRVAPLPPENCHYTRMALGLPTKKRTSIRDEWERSLVDYLYSPKAAGKQWFTTNDLLIQVLGIDEIKVKPKDQFTVGRIMKKLGWNRRRQGSPPRRYGYDRPQITNITTTTPNR